MILDSAFRCRPSRSLAISLLLLLLTASAHAAAPDLTPVSGQSVREGAFLSIPLSATDPDGDGVSFSTTGLPVFCLLDDNGDGTGSIDCSPADGDAGNTNITVTATDDSLAAESSSDNFVLMVEANTAPNIGNIGNASMAEGQSLNIPVNASDGDGDGMSFSESGLPGFCSLTDNNNGTADIDCNPGGGDAGVYPVTITVTDDAPIPLDDSDPFTLTVTANTAPVITPIADQAVAEGASLGIPVSASDTDNDGLTFSQSGLPGFCSLTDNGNGTGNIECNPGVADGGTYPGITITVTDDAPVPGSDSDSFTLTVTANAPPVLTPIADQSVAEGQPLNIPLSATDPNGDGLSFSQSGLPGFCLLTDNGNGTGNIACNPGSGDGGSYPVTITVTDNAPISLNDSDPFTLSVTANNPPVLTAIPDQSVVEGGSLTIGLNATDPDGDGMAFSQTGMPGFCSLTDIGNGTGSIACNPAVGDAGSYPITVTVTDDGPVPAQASDAFTLTVSANEAPTASNVTISGDPTVGSELTGNYLYADAEDDPEGTSTFRWLRDGVAIPGATGQTYTVAVADVETGLRFEVTPVASTGTTSGTPVQSSELAISNSQPSITGQILIEILEDTSREIVLGDLTVSDLDSDYPDDFTLTVQDGANYTRSGGNGNTITPALNFNGDLTVPVTVNDGFVDSAVFNLTVTVTPVNDAPVITGLVAPLSTPEDTPLTIRVEDLVVTDPDNVFPTDFTLVLQDGADYTRSGINGNTVTPAENFNGTLTIPATVSDLEPLSSAIFNITVDVASENDVPSADIPIGAQTAIENSPFELDVSGNFSDADNDPLTFSATGLPSSLSIDPATGVISGTPRFEEARDDDPYDVIVTAQDPEGAFVDEPFELTVSALDRANLALLIDVNSNAASPAEDLRWTFSAINPVGPQPGQDVELVGRFVGAGLTVTAEPGANCTIQPEVDMVTSFVCVLGPLPVGATLSTVLTTTAGQSGEVVAFATAAGADNLPIDPNNDDNSAIEAAGVAEAFSNGAVQFLGAATIHAIAAGDLDGDGRADIVVGTQAGQRVQIFFGDVPREACDCPRDFIGAAVPVGSTGANEGVALADFDGNGSLDIVVANGGGLADFVYFNDGTGDFGVLPAFNLGTSFARGVAVGDFNGDGNADVAIAAVGGNPVYLGNGAGGFTLEGNLGTANSTDVAAARLDGDNLDDLVFANTGGPSQVWLRNSTGGFAEGNALAIGDTSSVVAANLDGANGPDLVFGRIPADVGEIPSNPVLFNDGNGGFGAPGQLLGFSPTNDVEVGEFNGDGIPDIVFINASGVHQIWTAGSGGYTLHREQIIDGGALAGVVADLGFTDTGNPGGNDLAMGGANLAGVGVYLNDGAGNLGRGDAVPPVIELVGPAALEIPSGSSFTDSGATATDNIDGDITAEIIVTGSVNTAVVGNYTLTYTVTDFAGNQSAPVVRNVSVTPAIGTGGGGGGSLSIGLLVALLGMLAMYELLRRHRIGNARVTMKIRKDGRHD